MIAAASLLDLLRDHKGDVDDILNVILVVALLEFLPRLSRELRRWKRRR